MLGESSADGASLLWSEVEGEVLLALVEEAELGALVGLDDGQDAGNRLAEVVAVEFPVSILNFWSGHCACGVESTVFARSIFCMQFD